MRPELRECGDERIWSGREGVPGAYAFFARYLLLPWESCLDVGGGLGRGREILGKRSRHVRAIDIDPKLVPLGVELGRIEDEHPEKYDWVLAIDVMEHVEDGLGFVLGLLKASRKGIFLTTPNKEHHPDRAWPYHAREYSPEELRDVLRQACPRGKVFQFGGAVYGGNMFMGNLGSLWEHQAVLCLKNGGVLARRGLLRVRELAFRLGVAGVERGIQKEKGRGLSE